MGCLRSRSLGDIDGRVLIGLAVIDTAILCQPLYTRTPRNHRQSCATLIVM